MVVKVYTVKCNGCGTCEVFCLVGATTTEKEKMLISDDCVKCGAYVNEGPRGAIYLT